MIDQTVDAVAWDILQALHGHVPEDKRPMSWSDMDQDQEARIRAAAVAAIERVSELTILNLIGGTDDPLSILGARLADLLDADDWNNTEPLLLNFAARMATLRAATKPFAELARGFDYFSASDKLKLSAGLTVGDLRKVRDAYDAHQQKQDGSK